MRPYQIGLTVIAVCAAGATAQTGATLVVATTRVLHEDLTSEMLIRRKGSVVLVTPSMEVFVSDPSGPHVLVFNSGGTGRRQLGRAGRGPGEYERPQNMGLLGDTIWISDRNLMRVTYYARSGQGPPITRTFVGASDGTLETALPTSLSTGGRAIATMEGDPRLMASGAVKWLPLLVTSRDGSKTIDTLARLHVANTIQSVQFRGRYGTALFAQLFSDGSLFSASPNGEFVVVIEQSDQSRPEGKTMTVMRSDGSLVHRTRIPFADTAFSSSIAVRITESRFRELTAESRRKNVPNVLEMSDYAATLFRPRIVVPVTDVIVGDDGAVLLRGNDWTGTAVVYAWIRPDGTVRGRFFLPRLQTIKAVRGDDVWSLKENGDGQIALIRQKIVGGK